MSEKDEAVEEETQTAAAEQEVENEAEETADQDASTDETNDGEIDYQAELERLQTERDNYKEGLLAAKAKLKEKTPPKAEVKEEVSKEDLSPLEEEIRELRSDRLESVLDRLTSDPAKRQLILFHYQNSIRQTGFTRAAMENDLQNALILADKPRIIKENSEMKQTVKAKSSMTSSARGSNQDSKTPDKSNKPKLSAAEIALLARRGLKPENVKFTDQ